jgi:hypothetical protein
MCLPQMEDPLDFIPFSDVLKHGDPNNWKFRGRQSVLATDDDAPPHTLKVYESYEDEYGDLIDVHYFRHSDGSVSNVKVK